jgi:hypothetical protein
MWKVFGLNAMAQIATSNTPVTRASSRSRLVVDLNQGLPGDTTSNGSGAAKPSRI